MIKNNHAFAISCLVIIAFIFILISGIASTLEFKIRAVPNLAETTAPTPTQPPSSSIASTTPKSPTSTTVTLTETVAETDHGDIKYLRVVNSCNHNFADGCVAVRSGPGLEYPVVSQLRNDIVLKAGKKTEGEDYDWYEIVFDEWLRYPERVTSEWFVASDFVETVYASGVEVEAPATSTNKRIVVDRGDQKLYAYEGDELFMDTNISTGLDLSPTPRGTFTIFRKTPTRYMQGPLEYIEGSDYYDLPGVPWNLYFTEQGAVIHGAYWHNSFGNQYSHGCVNVDPELSEKLYRWAEIGTKVIVRD